MSFLDAAAPSPSVLITCRDESIQIETSCIPSAELVAELTREFDRPGFEQSAYSLKDFAKRGKLSYLLPHAWNPKTVAEALVKLFEAHGFTAKISMDPSYVIYLLKHPHAQP